MFADRRKEERGVNGEEEEEKVEKRGRFLHNGWRIAVDYSHSTLCVSNEVHK